MTREEKLDKIYKVVADNTLSYGCRLLDPRGIFVERKNKKKTAFTYYDEIGSRTRYDTSRIKYRRCEIFNHGKSIENKIKKIGHPVMIGDVLNWIENKYHGTYDSYNESPGTHIYNCLIWRPEKHRSIEEQNDDCVDFVYDLIAEYTSF